MKFTSVYIIACLNLLVCLSPLTLSAEEEGVGKDYISLRHDYHNVVHHGKRGDGFKYPPPPTNKDEIMKVLGVSEDTKKQIIQKNIRKQAKIMGKMGHMFNYKKLPNCTENKHVRIPVNGNSLESRKFDFILYAPEEAYQAEKASSWKEKAVPYIAGSSFGLRKPAPDPRPLWGLMVGVPCLPTRIHFITTKDGRRFAEYRIGEKAWEEPTDIIP